MPARKPTPAQRRVLEAIQRGEVTMSQRTRGGWYYRGERESLIKFVMAVGWAGYTGGYEHTRSVWLTEAGQESIA